jgi:predicted RND superfamily exporter protein
MIAALGVDYSIFLMMRYNELEGDVGSRIEWHHVIWLV